MESLPSGAPLGDVAHAPPGPSRAGVDRMFDRIANRYDLANRVLSMGLDVGWRERLIARLTLSRAPRDTSTAGLRVLDVATGTGDLAIAMGRRPEVGEVVGVDISEGMLARGREKVAAAALDDTVVLATGDATRLEAFRGFDVATISFGIRNVRDTDEGLRQLKGVLRPGGALLVLEFAEPTTPVFSQGYRLYRRHLLPVIGGALTGDRDAYRYLDDTIRTFPSGEAFLARMRGVGFVDVSATPLTFGSVMLYQGFRAADDDAHVNAVAGGPG